MIKSISPLVIGDITIPIPIIQGGMGVKVSTASLASAVANYGGAGTIASIGLGLSPDTFGSGFGKASCDSLTKEIRMTRERTDGVFGVNILGALTNFEDMVRTACQEDIQFIVSGAGLPLRLPEFVEGSSVKLIPIVSSARVAYLIMKSWYKRFNRAPNAIVVEGPLAGGHLGFSLDELMQNEQHALERIVKEVLETTKEFEEKLNTQIPIIAAGGIYNGSDIARFLKLGAKGVQMGTRFVVTDECSVPDSFKQKYIDAKESDMVFIDSPVGLPARAIRTQLITDLENKKSPIVECYYKCLKTCNAQDAPYCIAKALVTAVEQGCAEDAIIFAGANAYKIQQLTSVKELMDTLVDETMANLD